MPIDSDAIGISYRIDLNKLAESIRRAKSQLAASHKDLAGLAKKASVTIAVNDASVVKAKAKVKKVTNAIQASLDREAGNLKLKLTAAPETFAKIGGVSEKNLPRITKQYNDLFDMYK